MREQLRIPVEEWERGLALIVIAVVLAVMLIRWLDSRVANGQK